MKKFFTPPKLYQISIVLMVIVHFTVPVEQLISFPFSLVGVPIFIFGAWYSIKAKRLFKSTNTPMSPKAVPVKLHKTGQFNYSRNPMYLGITIGLFGIAILLGSVTPFIFPTIFFFIMNFIFIPLEEVRLEQTLGEEFMQYKSKVRRWI